MNKSTIELIRETGETVEKTCEAFAKELEHGTFMRHYELVAYSMELEKFLQEQLAEKFTQIRASIFLNKSK